VQKKGGVNHGWAELSLGTKRIVVTLSHGGGTDFLISLLAALIAIHKSMDQQIGSFYFQVVRFGYFQFLFHFFFYILANLLLICFSFNFDLRALFTFLLNRILITQVITRARADGIGHPASSWVYFFLNSLVYPLFL